MGLDRPPLPTERSVLPASSSHNPAYDVQARIARAQTFVDAFNRNAAWLAAGLIAIYILVFAVLACLKLAWFRQGFDMAGNEQTIWNTLHGRPFRISVFAFMEYDFDDGPVLLQLPLALLYGIYPSPYTLLVLQTLALGLAAWPLYLIGRDIFPAAWQALALVAIYLLHPTTQHINMYEFQLRAFMIPFALGALLFLRRGRLWPYVALLFLMMCTKTEAGFTLVAFGLYALWLRRPWPFAVIPLVLGPLWVLIALGVIVPRFSTGNFITEIYDYGRLGGSVGEVIVNVITNPLLLWQTIATPPKLDFLARLFGLHGFLALLSPTALLGLPILLMNLISPNRVQWSLNYQYPALIYPFLIVASAEGLVRLSRWLARTRIARSRLIAAGTLLMVVFAMYASLAWNNVAVSLWRVREPPERVAAANALLAQVPPDAAVAATSFLAPHLAQREEIYFFPGSGSYPREYIDRAEYIVADSRPPGNNRQVIELLAEYMRRPDWELVAQEGDFVLLRQRQTSS
jgi:uncharacterized membrane protein